MNQKFFWQQMFQKEGIMIRINEQEQGLSKGVITYQEIKNEEGKNEIHFNNGEKYVCEEHNGEKLLFQEGQIYGPLNTKLQTLNAFQEKQIKTSDDMELVFTVLDQNQKQRYLGILTVKDIEKQDKKGDIETVINQVKKYGNNFLTENEYLRLKQIDENYQISMKIEEELLTETTNKTKQVFIKLTVKLEKQNQEPEKFIKQEINSYKETQILDQTQRQINNLKTKLSNQFQDQINNLDKKFQEQIQQVQKALSDQIQNSNQQQEQQFQTLNSQVCTINVRLFKPLQSLQNFQPQKQQEIQHYILNESDASFEEDIIKLKEDLQKTKDEDINQQANQIEQIKNTLEENKKQFIHLIENQNFIKKQFEDKLEQNSKNLTDQNETYNNKRFQEFNDILNKINSENQENIIKQQTDQQNIEGKLNSLEEQLKQQIKDQKNEINDLIKKQGEFIETQQTITLIDHEINNLEKIFHGKMIEVEQAFHDQIQASDQQQQNLKEQLQSVNNQVCIINERLFMPQQRNRFQEQSQVQPIKQNQSSFEEDIIKLKEDIQRTKDQDIEKASQIEQIKKISVQNFLKINDLLEDEIQHIKQFYEDKLDKKFINMSDHNKQYHEMLNKNFQEFVDILNNKVQENQLNIIKQQTELQNIEGKLKLLEESLEQKMKDQNTEIVESIKKQEELIQTKQIITDHSINNLEEKFPEIWQIQKALQDQIYNSNQQQQFQFQTLSNQVFKINGRLFKPLQRFESREQLQFPHSPFKQNQSSFEEDLIKLKEDLQKTKDEDIKNQASQIEQFKKTQEENKKQIYDILYNEILNIRKDFQCKLDKNYNNMVESNNAFNEMNKQEIKKLSDNLNKIDSRNQKNQQNIELKLKSLEEFFEKKTNKI